MSKNSSEIPHGTVSGYSYRNCRCDECKKVWREYIAFIRSKPSYKKRTLSEPEKEKNRANQKKRKKKERSL